MARRFRKLFRRKANAASTTQPPQEPEHLVLIPPPPPDYMMSIPPEITATTGNIQTLDGKLAQAEMAARRAEALHSAAVVSAEYARALSKVAREAVACAEGRARALLPPYPEAPPPPYQISVTRVGNTPIEAADVYTVDVILERAQKASRDARDLSAEARKADAYTEDLARLAKSAVFSAQLKVNHLVK